MLESFIAGVVGAFVGGMFIGDYLGERRAVRAFAQPVRDIIIATAKLTGHPARQFSWPRDLDVPL